MPYNKWDVVFIPRFPNQENKSNSSPKPAIILEVISDTEVRVCPLTKQIHQQGSYADTIRIDKGTVEYNFMSLNFASIIVLDRIEEIDTSRIEFKFATCHPNIRTQIGSILKKKK